MGMTTCINFASNINKDVDEATHINAAINNKTFNDSLNAHEIDKEFNKYINHFTDFNGDTIEAILGLKDLTRLLDASRELNCKKTCLSR